MTQKLHYKTVALVLALMLIPNLFYVSPVSAQSTFAQSVNVAVIDSLFSMNGGGFPTTTSGPSGSFTDFNFYTLSVGNVSTAMLGSGGVCGSSGCDTVLLNVASSGMACDVNSLSAQQKTDLVNFVGNGYKLIIYDSECSPQDYSWLPYTFITANPGQQGAQGTLTIVEENTLSSNDPASPYYINAAMLASQTDAVGDMNVMTTFDPNWFLDMSGTNILGITGPVHTYAKYPSGTDYGLIIYNGMDTDYMSSSSVPDSSTPDGNFAKIWLQELRQPFNPSQLPGGVPVVGIVLTPSTAQVSVGGTHTVTATITDLLGNPQSGIQVTFSVDSGPNLGRSGVCNPIDCKTNTSGQVSFTYIGIGGAGTDQIKGCFTNQQGQTVCSQSVEVIWKLVGLCDNGLGLGPIEFPTFPPFTVLGPQKGLYLESDTLEFQLTGTMCFETPILINPGQDPSVTIQSKSGETQVKESGEIVTRLNVNKSTTNVNVSFLPLPPTLRLGIGSENKVKASDFELAENLDVKHNFTIVPPRIRLSYLVAVAMVAAIAGGIILAAGSSSALLAPAIAFLLALYIGPIKPPSPPASLSVNQVVNQNNYLITPSTAQQSVLDDLGTVFSPEFVNLSTVGDLEIDSASKGPGQNINYRGSNFVPEGYVYILLTQPESTGTTIEQEILADKNGAISGQIRLPADAKSGRWLLTAVDAQAIYNNLRAFADGKVTTLHYYLEANTVTIPDYTQVSIDIKPGGYPNAINLKNDTVIPVAILTNSSFDATTVNPLSVAFGPNGAKEIHKQGHIEDVDGDGDLDLVLHFSTKQTGLTAGDTQACLVGQTKNGLSVVGCETIVVVRK
jgi:hypothetical protein